MHQMPIIEKREYVLLKRLIRLSSYHFDKQQRLAASKLIDLLISAKILDEEEMPNDVIRLHTTVTVSQFEAEEKSFQIVLPEAATSKGHLMSVLSPLGAVCFGSRLGARVKIDTDQGEQYFTINKLQQSNKAENSLAMNSNID